MPDRGQLAAYASFLEFAHELQCRSEPLAREFAEMVLVFASEREDGCAPTEAAAELCNADITPAEHAAGRMLARAAILARDAQLDDATVHRLMALGAVFAARFESYTAERQAVDG